MGGGGGTIRVDENLAKVFGKKEGATISGMEMVGLLWKYIRKNNLQEVKKKKKSGD